MDNEIGRKIKHLREEKGITQAELAKFIKSTKQTVFKYEAGIITNIPMDKLIIIARVLGCTPQYLLGWENGNAGVNNGIIGNQNSNNVIIGSESIGDIETEIVLLCKKMTMQEKNKLLTYAYTLIKKEDK